MNQAEFAAHAHDQEIQRLTMQVARLRKKLADWHEYALDKSLEVGRLTEENRRLRAELAARKETA